MADAIAKDYADKELAVLAITDNRSINKVRRAVEKVNTSLPVLLDRGADTVYAYKAFAPPTLILLDRSHKVAAMWHGSVKEKTGELNEAIRKALEPVEVEAPQ